MVAKLNNRRIYPDANHQPCQDAKLRVQEAKERQDYNDGLTPQQKLEHLDKKLGVGVGAVKQRARLAGLIEKKNTKPVENKQQVAPADPNQESKKPVKKYIKDHQGDS